MVYTLVYTLPHDITLLNSLNFKQFFPSNRHLTTIQVSNNVTKISVQIAKFNRKEPSDMYTMVYSLVYTSPYDITLLDRLNFKQFSHPIDKCQTTCQKLVH